MSCLLHTFLLHCLMLLKYGLAVRQPTSAVVEHGNNTILSCSQTGTFLNMYWYRQRPREALECIVTSYGDKDATVESNFINHFLAERKNISVIELSILKADQNDTAVYYCAKQDTGNREQYFGAGTKLTVLEKDVPNREPNVVLFDPSPLEISQKKKATLVCLATNFYPGYVTLTWSVNGKNRTEGVKTDDDAKQDGGSRMYSLSSRLRLSMQEWFNARNSFQCTVHMYHPDEKDVQRTIMGQEGCGLSEESYRRHATSAKFTYILFLCKAALYGFIVTVLVWRFKGSDKQFT